MHNPWKVRLIVLVGLLVVASTLLTTAAWQVVAVLALAAVVFVYGLREATHDPHDLRELSLLEEKYAHLNPASTVICPHCGDEYPSRRSVCPNCLRSP
jgi:hypothetical protein